MTFTTILHEISHTYIHTYTHLLHVRINNKYHWSRFKMYLKFRLQKISFLSSRRAANTWRRFSMDRWKRRVVKLTCTNIVSHSNMINIVYHNTYN